ncbi:MAG: accessory gene regulator B family protein [Peptococcaceae bacterium]|nr:accessory gene regulator B family protein [Peptococcaceae bacterium]
MTYQLSMRLTSWFVQKGLLQPKDYDVYVYCIDSLLAKLFFYSTLFAAAVWFHILPQTVWYYIGFTAFRYTAGGYHANSDKACTVLTWAVYIASMLFVQHLAEGSAVWSATLAVCLVLFGTATAIKYAPIDHFNKPVSAVRKLVMRKRCLRFQMLFILLIVLLLAKQAMLYALCLALGNGIAAAFLLFAYYQKKGGNHA